SSPYRSTLFPSPSLFRSEYVGLGPYRLKEWAMGSYLLLSANDHYVLGRPKIDELEVRFILDANTVAASILAGAVQATIGTGLSRSEEHTLNSSHGSISYA